MARSPSEAAIQAQIRLRLAEIGTTNWRNNTGALTDERGRLVRYGLCPGSSDLIGLTPLELPDRPAIAVFTAIECKSATGRPTDQQLNYLKRVRELGGIAGIARSPDDAERIINEYISAHLSHKP